MKKYLLLILVLGMTWLFCTGVTRADITNGNFDSGLTGWTTADNIFTIPSLSVGVNAGQAVLQTQGYTSGITVISLYQNFTIPSDAYSLSFDVGFFDNGQDTGGTGGSFPDFFQATYWDDAGIAYDKIFLGLDINGPYDPNTFNPLTLVDQGNGLSRFTSVITDLQGHSGTLYFDLSDEDDDRYSIAKIDNVVINLATAQVPEPASLILLGCGLMGLLGWSIVRHRRFVTIKREKRSGSL